MSVNHHISNPQSPTTWARHALLFALLVVIMTPAQAQTYSFPFKAEDLKPGESIYTGNHVMGIQEEGEDIGARRYLGDGKWSSYKEGGNAGKNSDYVIYGKKVYAISDGIIVGCWRNAPENPYPPKHHPKLKEGFLPGGGNMLWVDQPDGKRVLYAHMITSSIPAALCPNSDTYFPMSTTNENTYVMLDAADQVPITEGQLLGRVGNSGQSSGPHLHIHAQKDNNPAILRFKKGRYKNYVSDKTPIQGGWKNFSGWQVPDGTVLIRPPRSNPYRMADFESYAANGKQHYAGILEPGTYLPKALFKDNWEDFLAGWQDIEDDNYRMKDFEAYWDGDTLNYAGIFEPGIYGPKALFKKNWGDFLSGWQAIEATGYRMKDFEVYKHGKGLMYAGIFAPGNYAPRALFQDNWDDFLSDWQAIEGQGYRMKDFETYQNGSKRMYAGIFEPGTFAPKALFRDNWENFLADWQNIEGNDYRLKDLEIYRSGQKTIYVGIFEPATYGPAALFRDDWDTFVADWLHLE